MRILLVEDDALLADGIGRGLSLAGFTVDHAATAEFARRALVTEHFDVAILDLGLPDADGLTVLQALRASGRSTAVLVLTARYALTDKIRAFELGADDFLMKPFEQAELAARCRALARRSSLVPTGHLQLGRLAIDLNGHKLLIDSKPIELTRREWVVLECLVHNVGRLVTKERLQQDLSGWEQEMSQNAVETHVSRLRSKLGDAVVIRTVRGLGYRLDESQIPENS